jgi:RsmE family RNA methyltransferase
MKKIIEHGTTMGVCEFIFYHAHLSEKSYETSKVLDEENYFKLMMAGLSQSGIYTHLPKLSVINKPVDLPDFNGEKFILSLRENKKFPTSLNSSDTITLAIGPERGFIPSEEELFLSKEFKPVRIVESILRVEHAVFASIAQIDYLRMK